MVTYYLDEMDMLSLQHTASVLETVGKTCIMDSKEAGDYLIDTGLELSDLICGVIQQSKEAPVAPEEEKPELIVKPSLEYSAFVRPTEDGYYLVLRKGTNQTYDVLYYDTTVKQWEDHNNGWEPVYGVEQWGYLPPDCQSK
jgi:hypothetical protein